MQAKRKGQNRPRVDRDANLGPRLVKLRKKSGMTQRQLAALADMSQAAYQRLERGRAEPRLGTLRRLAAGLGITVGELIGE